MIYSPQIYRSLNNRLKKRYVKDFQQIIKTLPTSKTKNWLRVHPQELQNYSSSYWFLLTEIRRFIYLSTIQVEEYSPDSVALSPGEDLIFETWNKSEFADVFFKHLHRGDNVMKASQKTLQVYDRYLVALASRIIGKSFNPKNYRLQTSLGDGLKSSIIELDDYEGTLMSSNKRHLAGILKALTLIKEFSPDSWVRFKHFTQVIIPIKQKEFVSYSHQELPGTSMINLFDRDFVDLLDDLLHENGHHHLNYYLNLGKLIEEPIDSIFYSPWRRTLRPLRGIYHAYFTFFWAFKLFSDLARSIENSPFTKVQREKIFFRAVEEYWMLHYTYQDLKLAKKAGLISTKGWELIEEQNKYLQKQKKYLSSWEKNLGKRKNELVKLKKTLQEAEKKYRLKSL